MEAGFWHERWEAGEIGFHQDSTHQMLVKHWPALRLAAGACVLVPLCGKSRDMLWLADTGYDVVGVELSEIAVQAFLAENDLVAQSGAAGRFAACRAGRVTLLCGDFFALTPEVTGPIAAVYDRAALVALPPDMRRRYVAKLRQLCAPGVQMLLITFEYAEGAISAPPFCVPEAEVRSLYSEWCAVDLLGQARAQVKGVECTEKIWRLEVRTGSLEPA
jgi:thiopurine S-methyltransferase